MKPLFSLFIFLISTIGFSQNSIASVLKKLNKKTIPYITVAEIENSNDYIFIDAREVEEFQTSHIKDAVFVGFKDFDSKKFLTTVPNKSAKIVVYCSVGVRSEMIGEKLKKIGYKNVYNLYGGIFDWKNNGQKVYKNLGIETEEVHTYNKRWSKYLNKGIKIY